MRRRFQFALCGGATALVALLGACGLSSYGAPDESGIPRVVELHLALPTPVIPLGTSARVTVVAFDAAGDRVEPVAGIRFHSTNPRAILVDSTGNATGAFTFASVASGYIVGSVNSGAATVSDSVFVIVRAPRFDYVALMLAEWVTPDPPRTDAAGVAYLTRDEEGFAYAIAWSELSGPPTEIHLHGPSEDGGLAGIIVSLLPPGGPLESGTVTGSFSTADIRAMGPPGMTLDSLGVLIGERLVYADIHTVSFPLGELRGAVNGPFIVQETNRSKELDR